MLGAAFTLRAIGDAGSGTLSWLSPLGWSLQVRPYAGDRWWVLLLHLATTAVLDRGGLSAAGRPRRRRRTDRRTRRSRHAPGRGLRERRSGWPGGWTAARCWLWTVGLCLYGVLMGSVAHGIGDELGDSTVARDIVARMGGTSALEQAFIAVAFTMLGMVAAGIRDLAHPAAAPGRVRPARRDRRWPVRSPEPVGWQAIWWSRWPGPPWRCWSRARQPDWSTASRPAMSAASWPTVVGTAAVQLPAVWLLSAVTVALFGLAPRFTPVAWGVLVAFVALYLIGSLAGFPQWMLDLEPFAHIPRVGGGDFTAVPLLWLLGIDAALIALGAIAFRRRDLRC